MNHAEINQLKFELEKERQELQKAMVTVNKMEEFERQFVRYRIHKTFCREKFFTNFAIYHYTKI